MPRDSLLLAPLPAALAPAPDDLLRFLGYQPLAADRADELPTDAPPLALLLFQSGPRDAAVELLETGRARWPRLVTVLLVPENQSADADWQTALGRALVATVPLPLQFDALSAALDRARFVRERAGTSTNAGTVYRLVGRGHAMERVQYLIGRVAPTDSNVLILGESGTGKEVVARNIHFQSARANRPFVPVNCGAIPADLLESELFGHEKGAFTGASGERKGRFELAHGGTLFLDEIGDISPAFQAKLLRVLQEREFERVGGARPIKVDVRLICATNRDLEKMVRRGEYRADLYYRINVVSIFLPPLRERRDDIPPLVGHFLDRFNKENRRHLQITPEGMKVLASCYWPGNVRELENCIERTATMVQGDVIGDFAFPCRQNRCLTQTLHFLEKPDALAPATAGAARIPAPVDTGDDSGFGADEEVTRIGPMQSLPATGSGAAGATPPAGERERLIWAMEQCGWVQAKAARLLRVTPRQLSYALQKHRIEVRKF
jgi:Nif-specific regulatory protein